jgi:hypothetical protein
MCFHKKIANLSANPLKDGPGRRRWNSRDGSEWAHILDEYNNREFPAGQA